MVFPPSPDDGPDIHQPKQAASVLKQHADHAPVNLNLEPQAGNFVVPGSTVSRPSSTTTSSLREEGVDFTPVPASLKIPGLWEMCIGSDAYVKDDVFAPTQSAKSNESLNVSCDGKMDLDDAHAMHLPKHGSKMSSAAGFNVVESPTSMDPPIETSFDNHTTNPTEFNATTAITSTHRSRPSRAQNVPTLHIRTDVSPPQRQGSTHAQQRSSSSSYYDASSPLRHSTSAASLPRRVPSLTAGFHSIGGSISPASVLSSPQIAALSDITPLPSPISVAGSPPWRHYGLGAGVGYGNSLGYSLGSRPLSRQSSVSDRKVSGGSSWSLRPGSSAGYSSLSRGNSTRAKKSFGPLAAAAATSAVEERQGRARSNTTSVEGSSSSRQTSDGSTKAFRAPSTSGSVTSRQRKWITSEHSFKDDDDVHNAGPPSTPSLSSFRSPHPLHREEYLAVQRGVRPPTPPRSIRSEVGSNDVEPEAVSGPVFVVRSCRDGREIKYRGIKTLGTGTFSRVILSILEKEIRTRDHSHPCAPPTPTSPTPSLTGSPSKAIFQLSRELIAMKVIDLGPAGGADEHRVENSLRREIEILKEIHHPSLVELRGIGYSTEEKKQAVLALNYCPGGDLFDVASGEKNELDVLGPRVIRRIFAELVDATRYLHRHWIVHRDIKLENVLLNLPAASLKTLTDIEAYPYPLVTLSDLGLSRYIDKPPASPLLTTRCGSEDYAAPEIIMGQPYDGRATDAWALGVLLYALMENRLPFDPLPSARGDRAKLRARTPHRIARVEYGWVRYGDENEEWDAEKGKELEGAHVIVEGLLKRVTRRISLDEVAQKEWVRDAIQVQGGIRRCEVD